MPRSKTLALALAKCGKKFTMKDLDPPVLVPPAKPTTVDKRTTTARYRPKPILQCLLVLLLICTLSLGIFVTGVVDGVTGLPWQAGLPWQERQAALYRFTFFNLIGLTYVFLSILAISKTWEVLRFVRAVGFAEYRKWILGRDLGFFIIPLIIICLFILRFPWQLFAIFSVHILNWLKSISPPQILMLHTFDWRTRMLPRVVANLFKTANVSSLHPAQRRKSATFWISGAHSAGVGARVSTDDEWRELIRKYMRWAHAVILDLSSARSGVIEEMEFILADSELRSKTFWLCQPRLVGQDARNRLLTQADDIEIDEYEIENPGVFQLFMRRESAFSRKSLDLLVGLIAPRIASLPSTRLVNICPIDIFQWFLFIQYTAGLLWGIVWLVNRGT